MADPAKYRTAADVEQWKSRDPIKVLGEKLDTLGLSSLRTKIEQEVEDEVQDSVRFAEESPFPEENTAMEYVYV
jgi:pyruvate dehydrogenase E1 component alpha subunit